MDYSLFDTFTTGVQVISPEYRYIYANAAAARHGRSRLEDLVGRRLVECYPGIERTQMFACLRRCMAGRGSESLLNQFAFPDASRQYFQLQMERIADGVLILSVDVTDQRARQVLTEHLSEELEYLVDQRTAELGARVRELDGIAYTVSHDLRAPVRTIAGFVGVLREDFSESLGEEALGHLSRIEKAAERMRDTLDVLLEHARLGSQREPKSVSLDDVMHDVEVDLASEIAEQGARLVFSGLPEVYGVRTELRLLLQNLVQNALHHRREGVPPVICVRASAEARPRGTWRISVVDNGRGIAPEDQGRVFAMFERAAAEDAHPGGLGMGLAHCDKIVGLHGGRLWVESTLGEGTAFHFTLPPLVSESTSSGERDRLPGI